ncbi:hypothetical protein [Noviherbaspirillum sp.]|jgi:pilus assembly protein TadC|uniref:hypothetical protein n=1 Tax=Noviherbaspirillum sp. TaxID=1926288 RepID=UPI0025E80E73|nr:hypothetical protein [Noviherbaspirillum sp.]
MTSKKDTDIRDINYEDLGSAVLLDRYRVPETYADGVSEILIGYPMTKITFHTVIESSDKEMRRACAMLTMDAPSTLDLAFDILEAFRRVDEVLLKDVGPRITEKLKMLLERIPKEEMQSGIQERSKKPSKAKSKEKK